MLMKKIVLSLIIILASLETMAQTSIGFANHNTPGLSDTLIKNTTITYGVMVENTGTQPITNPFKVYVAVTDSAFVFQYVDSITVTPNSLLAGNTMNVLITHLVDPAKFMDGGNTVVIWPAAPGVTTTDTIVKGVYVIDFQDVDELSENELIIYPNPVSDILFIRSETRLEEVRIFDLNGREVLRTKNTIIDLSSLETSIYLIEIKDEKGKMIRRKIMVE